MANRKISQLQKLDALQTGAKLITVQNEITKRCDLSDVADSLNDTFFNVNTTDGSTNYANRSKDADGNLYGNFRRVSGNFWVSGEVGHAGVHKGDGSIFKVTTQSIDMRSPERMRLDPTGNLSLGGSLHISGDNSNISGFGFVSRTATWLQHPVQFDSDVTGNGQWNFVGTNAAGKSAKFTAVPTVLSPGGSYDSVALSGNVVRGDDAVTAKANKLAEQVFINSGSTTTNYSLEQTGVRTNMDRIKVLSGEWTVGSGHLQAALDAGCCDNIERVGGRLGLGMTGFSGVFHVSGKYLNDKTDVLSGQLLGSAATQAAGLATTGVYTRENLASLNSYRAYKHTTGVFPCLAWSLPQPEAAFSCRSNLYVKKVNYGGATATRKKLYLLNFDNNSVTGLNQKTDSNWKYANEENDWSKLSNMIWIDQAGSNTKRTYYLAYHHYGGTASAQFLFQHYIGESDDVDWGKPGTIGTAKKLNPTNKDLYHHPFMERANIIFMAQPQWQNTDGQYPISNTFDITGSSYCTYRHGTALGATDDPVLTGDIYAVTNMVDDNANSEAYGFSLLSKLGLYKHKYCTDGQYRGAALYQRGLSGSAVSDIHVDLWNSSYKGRDRFVENFMATAPGSRKWQGRAQTIFQYNALNRRFYVSTVTDGVIHQFTINDGFKGPWSGVNPNDPLRGVNYGGGHLPSWWLAGTERYNYLAYEQSFLPATSTVFGHGLTHNNFPSWHCNIEFDPTDGTELAYTSCQSTHPFRGEVTYAPLVVPKPGRTPPIRNDGFIGTNSTRLDPFTRAEWTSWHTIS